MIRQLADTCLMAALLFLNTQLTSASGCVKWTVYHNQVSTNSLLFSDYKSVPTCQNYCVQQADCVAVDYVSSLSQCWVHTSGNNLARHNTTTNVPGVTQYRLNRTCDPHAATASTPTLKRACTPWWRVRNDTNAVGAKQSFTVPDVETCLSECTRALYCVAVDVNINENPLVCWPHLAAADLQDRHIFYQPGTTHYQLTGSCASDCVPQYIRMNDTNAFDAAYYFNVTSEQECVINCTLDLNCVAVDFEYIANPFKCWLHFEESDIRDSNLYSQPGTTLFIPVKRCIASLSWATTVPSRSTSETYATSTTVMQLLLVTMALMMT